MALILSRQDTDGLLDLQQAIDVLEAVMIEELEGNTFHMPPFGGGKAKRRQFRLVGGGLYGIGRMGIRLTGTQLLDTGTGRLLAIVGGNVSSFRIPAMMAMGARYLSRPDVKRVGLLGTGRNALGSLKALQHVRPIERVEVFSPTAEHREEFAKQATDVLKLPVTPHARPEDVIRDADVMLLGTSSYTPVLSFSDLRPGVHVGSWGMTSELDESIFQQVDQFAVQNADQEIDSGRPDVHPYIKGILWQAIQEGRYDPARITLMGSIIRGDVAPRNGPTDITLFRDSRGGVGDVALANYVYEQAKQRGLGTEIDLGGGV
jgi:ornithine cyclodeaminase/alanine dehydrogenase-like protein (mu-crystallin family)